MSDSGASTSTSDDAEAAMKRVHEAAVKAEEEEGHEATEAARAAAAKID